MRDLQGLPSPLRAAPVSMFWVSAISSLPISILMLLMLRWLDTFGKEGRGLRPRGETSNHESLTPCVDQRQAVRGSGRTMRTLIQLLGEERLFDGWIIDWSIGGVGLVIPVTPTEDLFDLPNAHTILSLKPTQAPTDAPWRRIEVRHIRHGSGYLYLGGTFVDKSPASLRAVCSAEQPNVGRAATCTALERREWLGRGAGRQGTGVEARY